MDVTFGSQSKVLNPQLFLKLFDSVYSENVHHSGEKCYLSKFNVDRKSRVA